LENVSNQNPPQHLPLSIGPEILNDPDFISKNYKYLNCMKDITKTQRF
jgi:hypothetical protein